MYWVIGRLDRLAGSAWSGPQTSLWLDRNHVNLVNADETLLEDPFALRPHELELHIWGRRIASASPHRTPAGPSSNAAADRRLLESV